MNTKRRVVIRCLGIVSSISLFPLMASAETFEWFRQPGDNAAAATGLAVSADRLGNVYFSGVTSGDLGGPNAGGADAVVGKYDVNGNVVWIRQLGSGADDFAEGVAADGLGNVYLSGQTRGLLDGSSTFGLSDAFLAKYDAAGNLLWTRQYGTAAYDDAKAVSADSLGNVFITGQNDVGFYASMYDADGRLKWTRQFETTGVRNAQGVAADGLGNVYISGGDPFSSFANKYDNGGGLLWTQDILNPRGGFLDTTAVTVDDQGNAYVVGWLSGVAAIDNHDDAFLLKYDATGHLLWRQDLATFQWDQILDVTVDGLGRVYVAGWTGGALDGPSAGGVDAFIAKYDVGGNLQQIWQLGTSGYDQATSISADGHGNVYFTGRADGDLSVGFEGRGAFLARMFVPEPSVLGLALLACLGVPAMLPRQGARR